jgi:trehalose 6-phosphate synthase/phosphatase
MTSVLLCYTPHRMARVIIVSNRLPVSVKKVDGQLEFNSSIGGLATGLSFYMHDRNNRWIGWPGIPNEELSDVDRTQIIRELRKYNCSPVFLTHKQVDDFYNGYSNTILWPFFHNLPVPNPATRAQMWRAYKTVNKSFAQEVNRLSQSGSRVWVQDYHFLLLPEIIRSLKPSLNVGFFLHIPCPSATSFKKLPEARQLIIGMLGADLVGFHTKSYVSNFLDTCATMAIGLPEHNQVILGARTVRVADFPMGIDYKKYAAAGKEKAVKEAVRKYRARYKGRKVIVAVDRMDPSKGLVERLQAYRLFLEKNPKWRRKVVLSMVAAPSRTDVAAYQTLNKRLNSLVAEINKQYASRDWQPIDYMNEAQPFQEVTALFQLADVAFIAPIRDGMNLVAKEYVAARAKNGVLILSETAGAAQELTDALLVDPKKPETVVAAIEKALSMNRRELRKRFKRMQKQLSSNTVQHWAGNFMNTLGQPLVSASALTYTLTQKRHAKLVADFLSADKRLILLDYDGTLVDLKDNYMTASPPKQVSDILKNLTANPKNTVVLISGRSQSDLQAWFGDLQINLVAEHGALVRLAGRKSWLPTSQSGTRWKKAVLPTLQTYTQLTKRSRLEEKQYSLVWHYRQSPSYTAQKNLVILQRLLKPVLKSTGIETFTGSKILEIKDPKINKGFAVQRWLKARDAFTLAIGDDATDEDMFSVVPSDAYSIKVGPGRTTAHYRLQTPSEVLHLLQRLAK